MRNCIKNPPGLILFALVLNILLSMKVELVKNSIADVESSTLEDFYPDFEIIFGINKNRYKIYEHLIGKEPILSFEFNTSNIPLENILLESLKKKNNQKIKGKTEKPINTNEKGNQDGGKPRTFEERLVSKESQPQITTEDRDPKTMTRDEKQKVRNEMKKLISQMFSLKSLDEKTEFYDFHIFVELPANYLDQISIDLGESTPKLEIMVNEEGVLLNSQTLIFKIENLKVNGSVIGEFIEKKKSTNVDLNGSVVIKRLEVYVVISNYRQGGFPDISFTVIELVIEEVKVNEGKTNQSWMAKGATFIPSMLLGYVANQKKKIIEKVIIDYFEWYREYAKEKFDMMSVQKKKLMFLNGIMYDEGTESITLNLGNLNKRSKIVVTETTFTQITIANDKLAKLIY